MIKKMRKEKKKTSTQNMEMMEERFIENIRHGVITSALTWSYSLYGGESFKIEINRVLCSLR